MTDPGRRETRVILCEPAKDCADQNVNRWHCMRGHAIPEDGIEANPGICPLTKCDRRGANR